MQSLPKVMGIFATHWRGGEVGGVHAQLSHVPGGE